MILCPRDNTAAILLTLMTGHGLFDVRFTLEKRASPKTDGMSAKCQQLSHWGISTAGDEHFTGRGLQELDIVMDQSPRFFDRRRGGRSGRWCL
jgi:hypothetical protein